jgi:hypothetical protein
VFLPVEKVGMFEASCLGALVNRFARAAAGAKVDSRLREV